MQLIQVLHAYPVSVGSSQIRFQLRHKWALKVPLSCGLAPSGISPNPHHATRLYDYVDALRAIRGCLHTVVGEDLSVWRLVAKADKHSPFSRIFAKISRPMRPP
jgi:hypothetical protein